MSEVNFDTETASLIVDLYKNINQLEKFIASSKIKEAVNTAMVLGADMNKAIDSPTAENFISVLSSMEFKLEKLNQTVYLFDAVERESVREISQDIKLLISKLQLKIQSI